MGADSAGIDGPLTLSPSFSKDTTTYTASVPNSITHVTLRAFVAHVGASPVAEGQGRPMLAFGGQKQRADLFLADVDVQFVHQAGKSAAELITVPTSPYSTDSSTLIQ